MTDMLIHDIGGENHYLSQRSSHRDLCRFFDIALGNYAVESRNIGEDAVDRERDSR